MRAEIFALCEAAEQLQGKLTFLGVFDSVVAQDIPLNYGPFSIVARVRFDRLEAGEHRVQIHLVDEDGRQMHPPLFDGSVRINFRPGQSSATMNLTHTIENIQLPAFTTYDINLLIDGEYLATIPLAVRRVT